ncbi:OmpW/AlkL family protein [Azomonas macrocytogenes]|uniref:Outer membrane protein n=1 Tax=Azomonas macrocytogenes TaxID=69962 RepID=A0A839T506_AZOMA|nr:OmpW family outer membrane protein [Azomonas macrocytogenes]MBB3104168.1 outer membrane protein [Azomonas macrocytogenes]
MRKFLLAASVLVSLLAPSITHAYQQGDLIFRAGLVTVDPHERSEEIDHATLGKVPGSKVSLDSETQLGLNYTYMMTDHFGVELLAATPFLGEVKLKGMPGPYSSLNGRLGDTKYLPPTLSVVYFPLSDLYRFQPYVGVGVNYTAFFKESLGTSAHRDGFHQLQIDDSIGLAAQVGLDYMLTDQFLVNAQVRYIDISTQATTKLNGQKVDVDVNIDPMVYMFSVGYRF